MMTRLLSPRRAATLFAALALAVGACDSADVDNPPPPQDTTPPSAVSATSTTGTTARLTFSEALDPASVTPAAFSLAGNSVTTATPSGTTVTVAFGSELPDDERRTYVVSYTGVRDAAGNAGSGSVGFSYGSDGDGGGGGNASQELGAAYPNAGDNRINIFNTDGDRFLLFNPNSGTVTDADDIDDVESGADGGIPLSAVGAAASVFSDEETVFFAADGDTYTKYERDQSDFDIPESFEAEFDDAGYDLDGVGAAYGSNGERIILFNRNGTQWQEWYTGSDGFSNVFSFPADFSDGSAPISSVGAAFYVEEANEVYLINRQGTQYTIFSGNGFTAAFPISELADFQF